MKKTSFYALASAALITLSGCGGKECPCHKKHTHQSENKENSSNTRSGANQMEIKRTSSGLGYQVIKQGNGAKPKVGQTVTVNYTGYLDAGNGQKGKQFDSSIGRGPFKTPVGVGRVIKGWDEGLQMMQVGETAELYIPASLGYGISGYPPVIPGNADLIFTVELVSIN